LREFFLKIQPKNFKKIINSKLIRQKFLTFGIFGIFSNFLALLSAPKKIKSQKSSKFSSKKAKSGVKILPQISPQKFSTNREKIRKKLAQINSQIIQENKTQPSSAPPLAYLTPSSSQDSSLPVLPPIAYWFRSEQT
jgi:hypothetical protein